MRPTVLGILATAILISTVSCGGGNSGSSPQGGSRNGPTSGEYLLESISGANLYISAIDSSSGTLSAPIIAGGPAWNSNGNVPSLATDRSNGILYALDTSVSSIRGFSMVGPGVTLTELSGPPLFAASAPLNNLTIDPTGKFLYVIESPATIQEFTVDATTGHLMKGPSVTEMADLRQAIIDPTGKFLFAIDLTGGRVFAYGINAASGSLSAAPGSPFMVPASGQPVHEVLDNTGKFLYASLFSNGVVAFAINSSSGALTVVQGSPFPTTNTPSNLAGDPSGPFIYVCNFLDGSIDGFTINVTSGALTAVIGSPFSTAPSPTKVVVDPAGTFVYVSIYPASVIYGFSMNSATGSLSALNGSPFLSATNPTNMMSLKIP